jgi:hypothetical protein
VCQRGAQVAEKGYCAVVGLGFHGRVSMVDVCADVVQEMCPQARRTMLLICAKSSFEMHMQSCQIDLVHGV